MLSANGPRRTTEMARLDLARLKSGPDQPLEETLRKICEIASETLQVSRTGIWFFSSDRQSLRCVCLHDRENQSDSTGMTLQVAHFPGYFSALEKRRSISAEVAHHDPRTHELAEFYLKPLNITSLLDAPIFRDGEVIGVACHEQIGPIREWSNEERDFAASVADRVALVLNSTDLAEAQMVLRDTDELKQNLHRLETSARIAAEAAHDFKNILTVIIGFAHELASSEMLPPAVAGMAKHILQASDRGIQMIQQMTAFGRSDGESPTAFHLGTLVTRVIPLLEQALGNQWTLEVQIHPETGRVFMVPLQLERLLSNLVMNARDSMPEGGSIRIQCHTERIGPNSQRETIYNVLTVEDHGSGIPESIQNRIFDPYFTTKSREQGTGLGLAIVQRIVNRAGGMIRMESSNATGTTFRIYLPFVARN